MGSVGKTAKKLVKEGSGYSTFKSVANTAKGMINPEMPPATKMDAPKPVAPATQQSDNVQQAKDYSRRKSSSMKGRSSSNLLDPVEAKEDKQKDILG
tara:strand:+ start:4209 stop:4499 length:291 start_codon:yes stop_codon:yes gene_type:complete